MTCSAAPAPIPSRSATVKRVEYLSFLSEQPLILSSLSLSHRLSRPREGDEAAEDGMDIGQGSASYSAVAGMILLLVNNGA